MRREVLKSFAHAHTELSTKSHTNEKVTPPYGVRAHLSHQHAPIVRTAFKATATTAVCRYSRPTAATGITVSNTATKQMLLACRRPAKRMLSRFGPMLPRRHRCNCRAIRPTAGVAAPSESLHRDALAVKTRKRAESAIVRLERGGPRSGDGLEFGIFAQSVLTR